MSAQRILLSSFSKRFLVLINKFPSEQFDYILFNTVVCFLDAPIRAFSEAKRVLKSKGVLIIGMIDKNSRLDRLYEARKKDNLFYQNAHFYSVDEIIIMINQLGFTKKEIYQTIFSPLDEIYMPEPVKSGHGEGGFVVIQAIDRLYGVDADVG